MKMNSMLCRAGVLAAVCVCAAVAQQPNQVEANGGTQMKDGVNALRQNLELLSDTQGVNFDPYMKLIIREIYGQWMPLVPADVRLNPGETQIRFTINPDGTIAAMHLEGSSHDEALNRAAWGSITGVGHFPALPKDFHGQNLELRIHFVVNW
jgi:TonB family protein